MGARDVPDIWRKVACLSQSQREAIGLRVRDKHTKRLKMHGCDALNDLLAAVEPTAYPCALTAWLQANAGVLPRSLALDGKSAGDGRCGMIVTLCRHEDGRAVAMVPASGKKEDGEVCEARALLSDPQVEMVNGMVTDGPLHHKEATVRVILEKGGDYLIGTKDNTSKRLEGATRALDGSFFDLSCKGDHGRMDSRKAAVEAIAPVPAGLPGTRCTVTVRRDWSQKKEPQTLKSHTRVFPSSPRPEEKSRSPQAVGQHWSIEPER